MNRLVNNQYYINQGQFTHLLRQEAVRAREVQMWDTADKSQVNRIHYQNGS